MDIAELAHLVQQQADIEAIKQLKYRYCAFCDNGYDADGIASLYTEDGVFEGDGGCFEGREAIRKLFNGSDAAYEFAIHNVMNPIITVDGDEATGEWKLFQPCTINGQAFWISGVYRDRYVRIDGAWRFKHVTVRLLFCTPYDEGWAKTPFGISFG
ncbi:MAG TPA: nuclear transport factor 2 family protein [Alphaproteobacteria bacterium]|nr:nuclear transport factor 2 family protein [Alphaproteobacteria bacterium]